MTTKLQFHLFVMVISISVCHGLVWLSPTPNDGARLYSCVGDTITLSWNFNLDSNETVDDLEWYFERSGRNKELLATYISGQFIASSATREDISFVSNAGIRLNLVTAEDYGTYSIRIDTVRSEALVTQTRSVLLQSPEAPDTRSSPLQARLLPEAKLVSGSWFAHLACGSFVSLGEPAFTVVWKTPSNAIVSSTSYENGEFLLRLNNPVQEGSYTCHLHTSDATARCVTISSALEFGGEVNVDNNAVQLAIVRGTCAPRQQLEQVTSAFEMLMNRSIVRLVDGDRPWKGRVEVFYNHTWGTVCDDSFSVSSATVVCSMLGLEIETPVVSESAAYGQGRLPILLDDVSCLGNETSIFDCFHSPVGTNNCQHSEDVGVNCLPSLTST